ncbi:MAG: hypothetical protein IPM79_32535 [Polyangiaceae bacterium]|nr:hypothetical protein [Polyangiaceae bacterium]
MGDFFAWCFRNLGTSFKATRDSIRRHVLRGPTGADRLARYRKATPGVPVNVDQAFRDWKEVLALALSDNDKRRSKEHAGAVAREEHPDYYTALKESTKSAPPRASQPEMPQLRLPRLREPLVELQELRMGRGHSDDQLVFRGLKQQDVFWQINHLLDDAATRSELAEYLAWALERELFVSGHPSHFFELLTLRLARHCGWSSERLGKILEATVAVARRYQDRPGEDLIIAEAARLGCPLPPTDDAPQPGHVSLAKDAYHAFMNADFDLAATHYAGAARAAESANRDFEAWLYTYGHASALQCLEQEARTNYDKRNQLSRRANSLFEDVDRLERGEAVAHWLQTARSRTETLLKDLLAEQLENSRRRGTGSMGMRFSSAAHYAWRTYREVAHAFGPPPLQRRYLEPLLPCLTSREFAAVLAHAPDPKAWIGDHVSEWRGSIAQRSQRDASLVDAFFSDKVTSRTELVARLQCFPSIRSVLRAGDAERAFEWLMKCAVRVGSGWQSTAHEQRSVDGYWSAFWIIARWTEVKPAKALETAQGFVNRVTEEAGSVLETLYELPWSAWRLQGDAVAEGFFGLLSSEVAGLPSEWGRRHARDLSRGFFALRQMLDAGLGEPVVGARLHVWKQALDRTRELGLDQSSFEEVKRAAFLLEQRLISLGLLPASGSADLFERWFPAQSEAHEEDGRREVWVVLSELAESNELENDLHDRWRAEAQRALESARSRFWTLNPHAGYALKRLLVCSMKAFADLRGDIESVLLRLYGTAPDDLELLAPVLRREYWSADGWVRLMQVLLAACGGSVLEPGERSDEGLATRAQWEVLDLCGKLDGAALQEAPMTWSAMRSLALSSVLDERLSVANHAAFAVVKLAMDVEVHDEAGLFAATLRRMADDARVLVRLALADGGLALCRRAKHALVRDAAHTALETIRADDNAQVSWLLKHAERREVDRVAEAEDPAA